MAQEEITGLFQWLAFGSATADTATGVVSGGDLTIDPSPRQRVGIGGQSMRRGGIAVPGGSADFYLTYTNIDLFTASERATYPRGALTELVIEGGADQWSMGYTTAVIMEAGLNYAQGEGLKANVKWGALFAEELTGGDQETETYLDFEDYEFVGKFNNAEYGIESFSVRRNNNVSFHTNADTKAADSMRLPVFYLYGLEELTMDLVTGRPIPDATLGLLADELAGNFPLTMVGTNGSEEVDIVLANLMPSGFGHSYVDSNSQALWKYSFVGSPAVQSLFVDVGTGY